MGYSYNSNGQLVYTEGEGNAVTKDAKGTLIPGVGPAYMNDLGGGSAWEQFNGPAPHGMEYTGNGTLRRKGPLTQFADTVMTPKGFALLMGGMALAPGVLGALGVGGGGTAAAGGTLANSAGVGSGIFNAAATAGLPGALSGTAAGLGGAAAGGAGLAASTLANSAGVGSGIFNAGATAGLPGATLGPSTFAASGLAPSVAPTVSGGSFGGGGGASFGHELANQSVHQAVNDVEKRIQRKRMGLGTGLALGGGGLALGALLGHAGGGGSDQDALLAQIRQMIAQQQQQYQASIPMRNMITNAYINRLPSYLRQGYQSPYGPMMGAAQQHTLGTQGIG